MNPDSTSAKCRTSKISPRALAVSGGVILGGSIAGGILIYRTGLSRSMRALERDDNSGELSKGVDSALTGTAVAAFCALIGVLLIFAATITRRKSRRRTVAGTDSR